MMHGGIGCKIVQDPGMSPRVINLCPSNTNTTVSNDPFGIRNCHLEQKKRSSTPHFRRRNANSPMALARPDFGPIIRAPAFRAAGVNSGDPTRQWQMCHPLRSKWTAAMTRALMARSGGSGGKGETKSGAATGACSWTRSKRLGR